MQEEFNHEVEIIDTECPNCGAMWGIEEMSFQECDACGYPHCEDDEGFFSGLDDDFDDDNEDYEIRI